MIPDGGQNRRASEEASPGPDGRPHAAQPKWRRDFPIDWPQDEYVSRRDLVKFIGLTSAAFAVGQLWLVAKSILGGRKAAPAPQAIADLGELAVGEAKSFTQGDKPCLLVRMSEKDFVAYDQQCTHLLCPVVPVFESKRLHCPCHNGWFDLETGRPLAGPPRRPLPRVALEIRDGKVYALGLEEPGGET
jgi:nitrite reductase/ring-hydroxylating ferredoxin subunit